MRQLLFIFSFIVFSWANNWAQQVKFEHRLAEQLGLCTNKRTTANSFSSGFPCSQCKIQFVSLSPGQPADQLFLMEAQSPENCGSGGCTGTVYRKSGQDYHELVSFFGFFERAIPRSGNATPDIVYRHIESPRHDFNRDGRKDSANITARYRWNPQRQTFDIIEILSIELHTGRVDPSAWKQQLIREYQNQSPWLY